MSSFKDQNGKEWRIALDAPTIREIRQLLDIDLAGVDGKAYERLVDEPELLVDTLWVLCREQAETAGVSPSQFGRAIVGDTIDKAVEAMLAAITDFFPTSKRALLKAVTAKTATLRETGMQRALDKINDPALQEKILANLEAEMDAAVEGALIRSSRRIGAQDTSESAPAA